MEIQLGGSSYIIDEGALFAVDKDYLSKLNAYVSALPSSTITFPDTKRRQREDAYNKLLSNSLPKALLLDKRNVIRPGGTAIEICDVALSSKRLLHVKRGMSSASLSHLFAQGVVSGGRSRDNTGSAPSRPGGSGAGAEGGVRS